MNQRVVSTEQSCLKSPKLCFPLSDLPSPGTLHSQAKSSDVATLLCENKTRGDVTRLGDWAGLFEPIIRSVPDRCQSGCQKCAKRSEYYIDLYSIITWCYHDVIMMLHVALEWAGKEFQGSHLVSLARKIDGECRSRPVQGHWSKCYHSVGATPSASWPKVHTVEN